MSKRFAQKAVLFEVCFLQIGGSFDTAMLDKDTTYSVLYLFKHNYPAKGLDTPAEVSLSQKDGRTICSRQVYLYPGSPDLMQREEEEWLALEVGRFRPSAVSREINFSLLDESAQWKSGLVFAGVEIHVVPEEQVSTYLILSLDSCSQNEHYESSFGFWGVCAYRPVYVLVCFSSYNKVHGCPDPHCL